MCQEDAFRHELGFGSQLLWSSLLAPSGPAAPLSVPMIYLFFSVVVEFASYYSIVTPTPDI